MATTQVLLLEDVASIGRSGDIVKVKAGFARNYLYPRRKALFADRNAVRMQERLQEERRKQAEADRADSETVAKKLDGNVYSTEVKVDAEGHMYGSVTTIDVANLVKADHAEIEKANIVLAHPIKKLGVTPITIKLKEGVTCEVTVKVIAEGHVEEEAVEQAPEGEEAPAE